jgi:hypothetical protein
MGNPPVECAEESAIDVPIPTLTMHAVAAAATFVPVLKAERVARSEAVSFWISAVTAWNGEPLTGAAAADDVEPTAAIEPAVEPAAVAAARPAPPGAVTEPVRK